MCGIAGFFGSRKIDDSVIKKTLSSMRNRGPDFSESFKQKIGDRNFIYLLHSRLSIIDLNDRSNQPFTIKEYTIIFNGEIYNYIELKKNFREKRCEVQNKF